MSDTLHKPDGGPAFPEGFDTVKSGMTLRDYFAGQALIGELTVYIQSSARYPGHEMSIAARCYRIADAMIAARSAP